MSDLLQGMITEEELLKLLNMKASELKFLRTEKRMPYVRLSMKRRVYLEEDLMNWFRKNRIGSDQG